MDLEFRRFLNGYGITIEEYETMTPEEQKELQERFNQEIQMIRTTQKSENIKKFGEAAQGIGCFLTMIPVVIICIVIIWAILSS